MKRFRSLYSIAILTLLTFTACQNDDLQEQNGQEEIGEGITRVHLHISSQSTIQTRADWQDTNAGDDELMNIWTVVVVDNADNKVKSVRVANPVTGNKEIDNLETTVNLESEHTYRFYSFSNIHPKLIMNLMGTVSAGAHTRAAEDLPVNYPTNDPNNYTETYNSSTGGGTVIDNPYILIIGNESWSSFSDPTSADNQVTELIGNSEYTAFTTMTVSPEAMSSVRFSVPGNGFDPKTDPNIYGAKGIPMTNVQQRTVSGTDTDIDLIVVRALAKIELRFYNETGSDLYIRSATLTNLTDNTVDNLKLLPNLSEEDDMAATHKDIQPNLGNSFRHHYTYTLSSALKVGAVTGDAVTAQQTAYQSGSAYNSQVVSFYVNESQLPNNTDRYCLTLGVSKTSDGAISEYRYTIINGLNTTGETVNDWSYISRNDYRIIPLVLDDYQLKLVPYDFPPIGVYPCSVIEGDVYNTLTFHDYGHFHLLPFVTRFSEPTTEILKYDPTWTDATTPDVYWTLGDNLATESTSWGNSTLDDVLKWYADASFTTQVTTKNSDGFYRTDADETTERGAVATEDADEAGGVPRWDNTLKWKPKTTNAYRPFIYGYIAEPAWLKNSTPPEDLYQYHSLTVKLWKKGAAAPFRDLTVYFRMLLSKDQMSAASKRASGIVRHQH